MKKLYLFLLLLCNSYAFAFQTTFTTSILANEATDPINISALSRGYYIITVVADGNVYSQMFMKR